MVYIGYSNYIVILCITTGILILYYDVKIYKDAKMKKEKKVSKILGWFNVSAGIMVLVLNWAYQQFFW
ncbi:CLC_0170 family protein [Fredinandcohnia humi]